MDSDNYTGYKLVITIKRVRTDVAPESEFWHEPLDENEVPTRLSGLPQATKNNVFGEDGYIAKYISEDCEPTVPVTVDWQMLQDSAPYVNGDFNIRRNGVLIDKGNPADLALFRIGDILRIEPFHYHLAYRWPDDAYFQIVVEDIDEVVLHTYTGGSRDVSDVPGYEFELTLDYYGIYGTTHSTDATLAPLGFNVNNTTGFSGGVIDITVEDATTGLTMLSISEDNDEGSYNVKNDAGTQTVRIHNTTGASINVRLQTVTATFDETFEIVPGGISTDVLTKAGLIIDLMP